jgi:hypothetical protein
MQTSNAESIYNGEIVAGSLLVNESRKIARLLIKKVDPEQWRHAISVENILQKRSTSAAKRQARLIRRRLALMEHELWEIIEKGSADIATQAVLAAAIKHSRLIGDFMDKVIRRHWQTFENKITDKDFVDFIETCTQIDPGLDHWAESTRSKLKQVVFRVLAESGYIDNTRTLGLLTVSVIPDVRRYLITHSEDYVLRCMEATQ